jgi:hypothetical protein
MVEDGRRWMLTAHSMRTMQLYDRRREELSVDEVERIRV